MIQNIKTYVFVFGMVLSVITLGSGNVFGAQTDSIHSELEAVETELKDLEADLENDEEDETAFGETLPNTYSLDAGDVVDEGV
ncbi:MAG: hypothetical protein JSS34_01590 [Proteobacteria bacterium]|nr:hypothetical protein [Pseudomonadota bacterium]